MSKNNTKKPSEKLTKAQKTTIKEAKKQQRLQKKARKLEKKMQRTHDYAALYNPDKMNAFRTAIPLGYFLRFFSIGFSVFGFCALFADSFLLTELNYWHLLAYCVGAVTAFSLIFIGKWLILAGVGIIGAYVGLTVWKVGSPLEFWVCGIETVFNRVMARLSDLGFAAFEPIDLPSIGGIYTADPVTSYVYGGIFLIATVLALIFAAFSAKRTRLLPMLLLGGSLCVICFTYNLCNTNYGIAFVLAGLCSAVVLATYDKIYVKHKQSKKSRAYSGFSSALAGILAFAVLAIPTATTTAPLGTINFIADPMDSARMVVTTVLTGGNPRLNVMNTLVKRRSAALEPVEFTGEVLFSVKSFVGARNIYLRSWVADNYSTEDDEWSVLSSDEYKEMLESTDGLNENTTGDYITYLLATLLNDEIAVKSLPTNDYAPYPQLGYYATFVDVEYVGNNGLLYALPSSFVQQAGLRQYENYEEYYDNSVSVYSDGIYQSGWMNLYKSYSAMAMLPTYIRADYAETLNNMMLYYRVLVDFVDNDMKNYRSAEDEYVIEKFSERLAEYGIESLGTDGIESFLESGSPNYWYKNYVTAVQSYSNYVHSYYTDPTDSEGIKQVAGEIAPDFQAAETVYDKIMSVVNYMIVNYSYTTEPEAGSGAYESDLDTFLLETKNGYCVQFATAATLLLRELGIPARYVQGYIASDFTRITDDNGNRVYNSYITDEGAHAWVEVWVDGVGWLTIEVTPSYYTNLYYINTSDDEDGKNDELNDIVLTTTTDETTETVPVTTAPTVTTTAQTTTSTAGSDSDDDDDDSQTIVLSTKDALTILGIIAAAGVIALIVYLILRRSKRIVAGRAYYVERAVYGTFEEPKEMDDVSAVLLDLVYRIISVMGYQPIEGESPAELAYRIDHPAPPTDAKSQRAIQRQLAWPCTFEKLTHILEKRAFGGYVTREELELLGEFTHVLLEEEYRALPFYKKIWYRYIRGVI